MKVRALLITASVVIAASVVLPLAVGEAAGTLPVATTGAASAVSTTTAALNGMVNPSGSATAYFFQYGVSTAYGSQTAQTGAGSGTTAVPASAAIGALSPGATYHFRLVATNASGTADGADASFTTAKAPPAVALAPVTNVTSSSVVLHATVNPNGSATSYTVEFGSTAAYGHQSAPASVGAGSAAVAVSATVTSLTPGTSYHYRLLATNSAGTATSPDSTFTSAKAPPTAITGSTTVVASDSAALTGQVNPNGIATSYEFQYGPTASYGHQTPALAAGQGTAANTVQATIGGLSAGNVYHYRLIAMSADGTAAGTDGSFVTTGTPTLHGSRLPVVFAGATAYVAAHSVQLNGALNPASTPTTWYFRYGITTAYGAQTPAQAMQSLGAHPINARLTGLQAATTFHFRLVAQTPAGLYLGPDHTFVTKASNRLPVSALTVSASLTRRSTADAIAAYGRLQPPASLAGGLACNGIVEVQIERGPDTIALLYARVRPNCSYWEGTRISIGRLLGVHVLSVRVHFTGNATLLPTGARAATLRT